MPAPPLPERSPGARAAAPAGRGLLRSYTCLACGARHASWAAFRAHRAACAGRGAVGADPPVEARPEAPA
jgi:hypothetical protein